MEDRHTDRLRLIGKETLLFVNEGPPFRLTPAVKKKLSEIHAQLAKCNYVEEDRKTHSFQFHGVDEGAGKTTAFRFIMEGLLDGCANRRHPQTMTRRSELRHALNLLELFGTIQTPSSLFSTRCCTRVELDFEGSAQQSGSAHFKGKRIESKLMGEWHAASTFLHRPWGWWNYNVFYALLACDSSIKDKYDLHLGQPQDYRLTEMSAHCKRRVPDRIQAKRLLEGLDVVFADEDKKRHVLRQLSAILHIGNIRCSEKKDLVSMEAVTQAASLLGTSPEKLLQEISGAQQQEEFISALYLEIFNSIVQACSRGDSSNCCNSVSLLDLPSFIHLQKPPPNLVKIISDQPAYVVACINYTPHHVPSASLPIFGQIESLVERCIHIIRYVYEEEEFWGLIRGWKRLPKELKDRICNIRGQCEALHLSSAISSTLDALTTGGLQIAIPPTWSHFQRIRHLDEIEDPLEATVESLKLPNSAKRLAESLQVFRRRESDNRLDVRATASAICNWILRNILYDHDHAESAILFHQQKRDGCVYAFTYLIASEVWELQRGICGEMSFLFLGMLRHLGIPCCLYCPSLDHIIIIVEDRKENKFYCYDATEGVEYVDIPVGVAYHDKARSSFSLCVGPPITNFGVLSRRSEGMAEIKRVIPDADEQEITAAVCLDVERMARGLPSLYGTTIGHRYFAQGQNQ